MKEDTLKNNDYILRGLLQRALFGYPFSFVLEETDWMALCQEAKAQTVHLLIYDCLTEEERAAMPNELEKQWQMMALRTLQKNEKLAQEQAWIFQLFQREQIACTVFKGSSCAKNYPRPELRCAGDIDLMIAREDVLRAETLLQAVGYETIHDRCPWHTTMHRNKVIVELHFEPAGLPDGEIGDQLRQYFQSISKLNTCQEAVALLLHKLNHIRNDGLGLRQLCDWALFVKAQIDADIWDKLEPQLCRFGLLRFAKVITRACVDYLELDQDYAPWCMDAEQTLAQELLEDILQTGNFGCKEDRYGQKLFTDGGKGGRLASMWRVGVKLCKNNWSPCKRYPVLLPIAPVVLVVQRGTKRGRGGRSTFRLYTNFRAAKPRQKLYQALKPFQP